jgi:hypothetical protein
MLRSAPRIITTNHNASQSPVADDGEVMPNLNAATGQLPSAPAQNSPLRGSGNNYGSIHVALNPINQMQAHANSAELAARTKRRRDLMLDDEV